MTGIDAEPPDPASQTVPQLRLVPTLARSDAGETVERGPYRPTFTVTKMNGPWRRCVMSSCRYCTKHDGAPTWHFVSRWEVYCPHPYGHLHNSGVEWPPEPGGACVLCLLARQAELELTQRRTFGAIQGNVVEAMDHALKTLASSETNAQIQAMIYEGGPVLPDAS